MKLLNFTCAFREWLGFYTDFQENAGGFSYRIDIRSWIPLLKYAVLKTRRFHLTSRSIQGNV